MNIIGNVTSAIDLVKKAKELADKLTSLELKELIVELREKLLNVKEECLEYREEVEKLRDEIKRLSAPPEMTYKHGMYYLGETGPFCTACFDTGKKAVRATAAPDQMQMVMDIKWLCPVCKAKYSGK